MTPADELLAQLDPLNDLTRRAKNQMIDNASGASQLHFDPATREAIELNIIAPLIVAVSERDALIRSLIAERDEAQQLYVDANEARIDAEAALATAREEGRREAVEWQPIDTAPFNEPVDLWCIYGDEPEATWSTGHVIGQIVRARHRTQEYGWFGNQSGDGVPRADGPDLTPVAWIKPLPPCPVALIEPHIRQAAQTEGGGR